MQVRFASCRSPSPTTKADFVAATASIAVVLDGVSLPPGAETGCVHDAQWYVRRLGAALVDTLSIWTERALLGNLAQAIANVNAWHINACNLMLPSPSSAVAILREQEEAIEFLLLGDTTLLLDGPTGVRVITDRPLQEFAGREQAGHRHPAEPAINDDHSVGVKGRGRQDDFCRVSSDPSAVDYAVTGTVNHRGMRRAALLSDGASRLADRFGLMDWPSLLDLIDKGGPEVLIDRLREVERSDPDGQRWPRSEAYDDATAVACRFPVCA